MSSYDKYIALAARATQDAMLAKAGSLSFAQLEIIAIVDAPRLADAVITLVAENERYKNALDVVAADRVTLGDDYHQRIAKEALLPTSTKPGDTK